MMYRVVVKGKEGKVVNQQFKRKDAAHSFARMMSLHFGGEQADIYFKRNDIWEFSCGVRVIRAA